MQSVSKIEFLKKLEDHHKWLDDEEKGEKLSLYDCVLENMDLSGSNLEEGDFYQCTFNNINLDKAELNSIFFSGKIENSSFIEANLEAVTLCGDLINNNFTKANLYKANLEGCKLHFTQFVKVNLSQGYMSKSDFSKANLKHANLRNADLTDAKLETTSLEGANFFYCKGNGKEIKHIVLDEINVVVCIPNKVMSIENVQHSLEKWFTKDFRLLVENYFGRGDLINWWKRHKSFLIDFSNY